MSMWGGMKCQPPAYAAWSIYKDSIATPGKNMNNNTGTLGLGPPNTQESNQECPKRACPCASATT